MHISEVFDTSSRPSRWSQLYLFPLLIWFPDNINRTIFKVIPSLHWYMSPTRGGSANRLSVAALFCDTWSSSRSSHCLTRTYKKQCSIASIYVGQTKNIMVLPYFSLHMRVLHLIFKRPWPCLTWPDIQKIQWQRPKTDSPLTYDDNTICAMNSANANLAWTVRVGQLQISRSYNIGLW